MNKLIIFILSLALISCHSTFYPIAERNITCVQPKPAKIWSWHIHLLFFENNPGNVQGALKVRDNFVEKFKDLLHTENCKSFDHQNFNCMFDVSRGAHGPFPTSNWAVYLLPEYFESMVLINIPVTWMIQNREGYDILIHPNSGCSLEDHSNWAIFGGKPWELNMGAFRKDEPYQEDPFSYPLNLDKQKLKSHQEENLAKMPYLNDFLGSHENP